MSDKGNKKLVIDAEFKTLIRPLRRDEYAKLEARIVLEGCREPIITWNETIVDGHNRYEICNRLHVPYTVLGKEFDSREDAIIWICTNQLGRRNITEETRKYLIGRQYEAEKAVGFRRNKNGHNQYSGLSNCSETGGKKRRESGSCTANRISQQYHISIGAVQKYAKYSEALDAIADKCPEVVPQILSGHYKISHDNVVSLSVMEADEVQRLSKKITCGNAPFIRYCESRKEFTDEPVLKSGPESSEIPVIKTMPAFDPDAEVVGLMLTIPSWTSSIDRTKAAADLSSASSAAKAQLIEALKSLKNKVAEMLSDIEEDY